MRYYKDLHYFVYRLDFPHMGVLGVICPNTDGTVNIYINSLYSPALQEKALRHELRHMAFGHLWCDVKTLTEKELEADKDDDPRVTFGSAFEYVEFIPNRLPPLPPNHILLFNSLDSLKKCYEFFYGCGIQDIPKRA